MAMHINAARLSCDGWVPDIPARVRGKYGLSMRATGPWDLFNFSSEWQ